VDIKVKILQNSGAMEPDSDEQGMFDICAAINSGKICVKLEEATEHQQVSLWQR
jgi:hypothetical protein